MNDNLIGKKYFWALLDVLIIGIFANLVLFVMPAVKHYGDSLAPVRTMTVSAEGKANAVPDIAEISFSVVSRGKNPEELASGNNDKVSAAIASVKSEGVDEKDIKTTGYYLSPDYQYDPPTQKSFITGYTLTQTVNVKIRNLLKVAKILGNLTPLGVNQIGGVNFTIDDQEKVLGQARNDAFEKARNKAKMMAESNGAGLGRLLNVSESNGPIPIPYYAAKGAGYGAALESSAPTIEPGTQEVKVQVYLTYELR